MNNNQLPALYYFLVSVSLLCSLAMPGFAADLTSPTNVIAEHNRDGSDVSGSGASIYTINGSGFPGNTPGLGVNPTDDFQSSFWYVRPNNVDNIQNPPEILYYDLGEERTLSEVYLWQVDGDAGTGAVQAISVDYLGTGAAPVFTLTGMAAELWVDGISNAAVSETTYDGEAFAFLSAITTRYLRLTIEAAVPGSNRSFGFNEFVVGEVSGSSNVAPVITHPGDQLNTEGDGVNLSINASDADGNALIYTASGLPPQLGIDSGTGQITGTVTVAGTYNVTITVDDNNGGADSTGFTWVIGAAETVLFANFENRPIGPYTEAYAISDFNIGAQGYNEGIGGPGVPGGPSTTSIVADPASSGRGNVLQVLRRKLQGGGGGDHKSGMRFRADLPPRDEYYFAYDMYVAPDFWQPKDFKTPGLINGTLLEASHPSTEGPDEDTLAAFSALMQNYSDEAWGRGDGALTGYFYDKNNVGSNDFLNNIDPTSEDVVGQYLMPYGEWFTIEQHLKLNTVNVLDGFLKIYINGVLKSDQLHRWRADLNYQDNQVSNATRQIDGVWMTDFYGGDTSQPQNKPPNQQYHWYDNFIVSDSPITH